MFDFAGECVRISVRQMLNGSITCFEQLCGASLQQNNNDDENGSKSDSTQKITGKYPPREGRGISSEEKQENREEISSPISRGLAQ